MGRQENNIDCIFAVLKMYTEKNIQIIFEIAG